MGPGRPPFYKEASEIRVFIDAYFAHCEAQRLRATKPGLALFLGFESRQSLWAAARLRGKDFSYEIKRAHAMIENNLCQLDNAMAIFQLKAYCGLSDRGDDIGEEDDERDIDEAYL